MKGTAPPPEVTTPKQRRIEGVRVKRGRKKPTVWRGIPVTTVPQTLVDLAADLSADDLARACTRPGFATGRLRRR